MNFIVGNVVFVSLFTFDLTSETVFKEKRGVWDPMPEFTVTSPYVDFRSPGSTPTHGALGNPMPESASSPSQGLRICPQPTFMFSTDIPSLFHTMYMYNQQQLIKPRRVV